MNSRKKLTDEQKINLVKDYTSDLTMNCSTISKKYGICGSSVYGLLKRRGVRIRKTNGKGIERVLNHRFFKKIDTEAKAYFLGLFYADGCIHKNIARLALQERDGYILDTFLSSIEANFSKLFSWGFTKNSQNIYSVHITSKVMVKDLIKLGCMPRKTFKIKFPTERQVPSHLIHHFIRGVLDGDGCIYLRRTNINNLICTAHILSTKHFCFSLKELILKEIGVNSSICKTKSKGIMTFTVGGSLQADRFLTWLYKDATIFLIRKHDKYIEYKTSSKFVKGGKVIRED